MSKAQQRGRKHPLWSVQLGEKLRTLRSIRGDSLSVVAEATGVSSSFLSLLEQGRTDVSLGRLLPLLDYYRLSLSDLLPTTSPEQTVVRRADRPVLFSVTEGIDVYLAAPDQRGPFIPLVVEYRSGARMGAWSSHPGEEYVFALSGSLMIEFSDADTVTLHVGDSAFFSSRREHRIAAADSDPAQALIVTTERDPRDSARSQS